MKKIIFIIFLLLTACADPMLGKKLPFGYYPEFTNGTNGHHQISFERGVAKLDYEWFINNEKNTLNLKGSCYIYTADWKAFSYSTDKVGSLTISAFFLNENFEIVRVENIFFPFSSTTTVEEEVQFNKTIPYNIDYKFITFRLNYRGLH